MALSPAQRELRRNHIGASDANTIMWGTTDDWRALYNEKVKGVDPEFKQSSLDLMEMGHAMEPLTLRWFEREHHRLRILPPEYHVKWAVDPFFAFTPDGLTLDGGYPVQAKYHTGDKSILELAERYGAQLMHEMLCTGTKRCYLAVTFGHYGRRQILGVEHDPAAEDAYLERALAFKEYYESGIEPSWMSAPMEINIPRRRDHYWDPGDNVVAPLARDIMDNKGPAERYAEALAALKELVPPDAQTATWVDTHGLGIRFKVSRSNAKKLELVVPLAAPPKSVKAQVNPKKRQAVAEG